MGFRSGDRVAISVAHSVLWLNPLLEAHRSSFLFCSGPPGTPRPPRRPPSSSFRAPRRGYGGKHAKSPPVNGLSDTRPKILPEFERSSGASTRSTFETTIRRPWRVAGAAPPLFTVKGAVTAIVGMPLQEPLRDSQGVISGTWLATQRRWMEGTL